MKILSIIFTLALPFTLGACSATSGSARTRPAAHGITTTNSSPGKIASVRAFETDQSLHVAGTLRRSSGHTLPPGAHLDIALLDHTGRVIATERDRIAPVHPRLERRRGGKYSFAAAFPLATSRDAVRIRVSYHPCAHS